MIYKEKRIYCGKYLEIDIIPSFVKKVKDIDNTKRLMSLDKQKILNDKNSKRKLHQVILNNFDNNCFHLSLTYNNDYLPKTEEEAVKVVNNYIRRIKTKLKDKSKDFKYILVTEVKGKEGENVRIHHHMIVNELLSRDEYESLWSVGRGKNKKQIGYANADRLQFNEEGVKELVNYICKNVNNKHSKKWTGSQNLKRPYMEEKAIILSNNKIRNFNIINEKEYWESKVKGYRFISSTIKYNEIVGKYYIYLNMIKKE